MVTYRNIHRYMYMHRLVYTHMFPWWGNMCIHTYSPALLLGSCSSRQKNNSPAATNIPTAQIDLFYLSQLTVDVNHTYKILSQPYLVFDWITQHCSFAKLVHKTDHHRFCTIFLSSLLGGMDSFGQCRLPKMHMLPALLTLGVSGVLLLNYWSCSAQGFEYPRAPLSS